MLATAVLAAEYAGTFDLLDTTRVTGRALQPAPTEFFTNPPGRIVLAADVATIGAATLKLHDRRSDYTLSYSPSWTLSDVELGIHSQAFQTGIAVVGWHDRFIGVTVSEALSQGVLNTAYLNQPSTLPAPSTTTTSQPPTSNGPPMTAGGQPMSLQTPALANSIDFFASNTNASLSLRANRRLTVTLSGGYVVSGGSTDASKLYLPEQFGPLLAASVTYAVSPIRTLATIATAQQVVTVGQCPGIPPTTPSFCRVESPLAQFQETLRHQLSTTSTLLFSAGVAASVQTTYTATSGERDLLILPIAVASWTRRLGDVTADPSHERVFTLAWQAAPAVDIRTGYVAERLQTTATLTDRIVPRVTVTANGGLLAPLPVQTDPYPVWAVTLGLEARAHVNRQIDIGLGSQTFGQYQNIAGYGIVYSEVGYVSVTAHAQTAHF
jgi:hypothetical protein